MQVITATSVMAMNISIKIKIIDKSNW